MWLSNDYSDSQILASNSASMNDKLYFFESVLRGILFESMLEKSGRFNLGELHAQLHAQGFTTQRNRHQVQHLRQNGHQPREHPVQK